MRGGSKFTDFFTKSIPNAAKKVYEVGKKVYNVALPIHDFIKSNKIVSRGLNLVGRKEAAAAVAQAGYGRRKRVTRRKAPQKGGGGSAMSL
jgi:hypothetical protein